MEGFATLQSADRFCRLLVARYWFKQRGRLRSDPAKLTPLSGLSRGGEGGPSRDARGARAGYVAALAAEHDVGPH
jgi:hypothetical protein